MKIIWVIFTGLLIATILSWGWFFSLLHAAEKHNEKFYSKMWCDKVGGQCEYVLPDKSRVDCLTDDYAIEFEWAEHWQEAIGQSIYYAIMTDRLPGIVVLRKPGDDKYITRLKKAAKYLRIRIWYLDVPNGTSMNILYSPIEFADYQAKKELVIIKKQLEDERINFQ